MKPTKGLRGLEMPVLEKSIEARRTLVLVVVAINDRLI